jgi:hypothetical protein
MKAVDSGLKGRTPMRGTGMRVVRSSGIPANWSAGVVDRQDDHIKISYGAHRMPVALVAQTAEREFTVEFLLGRRISVRRAGVMLAAVRAELDFYLLCSTGPEPWAFARYHCDTVANACSSVHWSWQSRATETA